MAATIADIGYGAAFQLKTSSTYTSVAEVTAITGAGFTRTTHDATHLQSDNGWTEVIAGLKTGKPVTITLNYLPVATDAIMTAFASDKSDCRILFPDGAVGLTFAAIVSDVGLPDLTPDGKMELTAVFTPSGAVTLGAVSGS